MNESAAVQRDRSRRRLVDQVEAFTMRLSMERDAAARRTLRAELEQAEAALAEIAAGGPPLGVLSARIDAAKAKKRESVRVAWRAKRDSERATLKSSALKVDATIRHSDPWKSCMNSALPLRKPTGAPSTAGKAFDLEGKTLWPSMPQGKGRTRPKTAYAARGPWRACPSGRPFRQPPRYNQTLQQQQEQRERLNEERRKRQEAAAAAAKVEEAAAARRKLPWRAPNGCLQPFSVPRPDRGFPPREDYEERKYWINAGKRGWRKTSPVNRVFGP